MEKNAILEQEKLSTNLNTLDGILGLLERIISKVQKEQEVEEHELINGSGQITTARRIVGQVRETLDLSHIVD